jgi:hypothetical protein
MEERTTIEEEITSLLRSVMSPVKQVQITAFHQIKQLIADGRTQDVDQLIDLGILGIMANILLTSEE